MNHAAKLIFFAATPGIFAVASFAQQYDPLNITNEHSRDSIDIDVKDSRRDRTIPIRIYQPGKKGPAPVILFSHGLGGSRKACGYLGKHWSARGYVVVAMQHAGSDESVWKEIPIRERLDAMKKAPSAKNTVARFLDVKSTIDQLEKWNQTKGHQFYQRFNLKQLGMSGHSYGASTTQGVSGQSAPLIGQRYADKRINAAIMFSPNIPRRHEPKVAFGEVAIPWMLMTGTKDTSRINDTTVKDRRQVYPSLPKSIDKYELVLHDGEHHAFTDGNDQRRRRNPNHHKVILALSTAFWDAHVSKDQAAEKWLHGDAPKKLMQSMDEWQINIGKITKSEKQ